MTILQFVSSDLVLAVAIIFGLIGFTRGARREVTVTLFVLLAVLLTTWFEDALVTWINRLYRLVRLGLLVARNPDNPAQALQGAGPIGALMDPSGDRFLFRLLVFFAVIWLGYLVSRRGKRVVTPLGLATLRRPPDLLARLAGFVAGAINGFLISYFLLPRLVSGTQAVLVIPTFATSLLQQRLLPLVFILVVAVFIFVGWERARG